MKKVFIVHLEDESGCGPTSEVVVFSTMEAAKKQWKKIVDQEYTENGDPANNGYVVERNDEDAHFLMYRDGEQATDSYEVWVEEHEVDPK